MGIVILKKRSIISMRQQFFIFMIRNLEVVVIPRQPIFVSKMRMFATQKNGELWIGTTPIHTLIISSLSTFFQQLLCK